MKTTSKLTAKQLRFASEYLIDLNATQAAIRAGYSRKTAKSQGQRLLTKVDIKKYLRQLRKELAEASAVRAEKVVQELARIAFSNVKLLCNDKGELMNIMDLPEDVAACISEIKTKLVDDVVIETSYKLHSKIAALEGLGRHLGIFEKDNFQGETTINILSLSPGEESNKLKSDEN